MKTELELKLEWARRHLRHAETRARVAEVLVLQAKKNAAAAAQELRENKHFVLLVEIEIECSES